MPLCLPLDGGDALGHPIVSPSKWKRAGDTCHNHWCASETSINTKTVDHPTREGSISKECRSEMWGRVKKQRFLCSHIRTLQNPTGTVLVGLLCVMVSRVSGVRSPQPAEARICRQRRRRIGRLAAPRVSICSLALLTGCISTHSHDSARLAVSYMYPLQLL